MTGAKLPIALSAYNHQALPHEEEFARRRHLSYERSHRAAGVALRALQAERGDQPSENAPHDEERRSCAPTR